MNLKVKWMVGGVEPDFRTISDFRKENIDSLKGIFYEFNRKISCAVEWGFVSIDGSKFQADNGKDKNFTKDSLERPCREWQKAEGKEEARVKPASKPRFEKVKVVKFFFRPSMEKMSQRMCLSEHPFGTIKRAMGAIYSY